MRACNNEFVRPVNSARPDISHDLSRIRTYIYIYKCVCACACVSFFQDIFRNDFPTMPINTRITRYCHFQRENENEKIKKKKYI